MAEANIILATMILVLRRPIWLLFVRIRYGIRLKMRTVKYYLDPIGNDKRKYRLQVHITNDFAVKSRFSVNW